MILLEIQIILQYRILLFYLVSFLSNNKQIKFNLLKHEHQANNEPFIDSFLL